MNTNFLTLNNIFDVSFLFFSIDSSAWSIVFMVMGLIVLLFLSAMVSGSEVAFFSLSPFMVRRLEEEQSRLSSTILTLLKSPRELLATILIFNNLINVAVILLSSLISSIAFSPNDLTVFNYVLSGSLQIFLIDIVFITFIILVFGEVVPKVYAARAPLNILELTMPILYIVNVFFIKIRLTPLLVRSTNIFRINSKINAHKITMDDLQHALDITQHDNTATDDNKILSGVVKFGNIDTKQIMTPRVQSVLIDQDTPFEEVIRVIRETHYSRIPIYEESIDQVKGVIYAKDLLPFIDKPHMDWKSLIRPPFFVPENKKIDDLLKEFQIRKTHLAIVVDEYGGVSGLVSLEDVIEEIVGDITDEFDEHDSFFSKISDDCFVFEGNTSLINMYRVIGLRGEAFEDHKGEADSIAGFVLEVAGRIPVKGESIKFNQFTFTIESADKRRIKSVRIDVERQTNKQ